MGKNIQQKCLNLIITLFEFTLCKVKQTNLYTTDATRHDT